MLKPPTSNLPGAGAMNDTLDFVKNLWGSLSVPGMNMSAMAVPAMSEEDLDKKIADLKAVESWLNLNLSMLRGTIQTLEVQRGTIITLKSMGAALASAVKQPGASESSVLAAAPYASAFFGQPAAKPETRQETKPDAKAEAAKDPLPAAAAAAMTNPAAWWNMLQDQFKQAVTTAMSPETLAKAQGAEQPKAEGKEQAAKMETADKAEVRKAPAKRAAKPKDEGK